MIGVGIDPDHAILIHRNTRIELCVDRVGRVMIHDHPVITTIAGRLIQINTHSSLCFNDICYVGTDKEVDILGILRRESDVGRVNPLTSGI